MATQTPAMCQNENQRIARGKAIDGGKTAILKPEKKERKQRKALADLSNTSKPVVSAVRKGSTVKGSETKKIPFPKNSVLANEEIKKYHEWAKEGIERCHFTGNDILKYEREAVEKRVKQEVDMVMSSLSKWNDDNFSYAPPIQSSSEDFDISKKLELEPEIPLYSSAMLPISGECEAEEPETRSIFVELNYELKLKEENDEKAVD